MRTLRVFIAAAFMLSAGGAYAQDLGSMVSGVYGKKSAIYTGKSRSAKGSSGSGGNVYRAFMHGKGSYEARMAKWGQYCDNRGDGEAAFGAVLNAAGSFVPGVGAVGGIVEREGSKSESRCHYWRTAFMTQYERARTQKDNDGFIAAVRAEIAVLAKIQDKQVTPEVVEEIIARTVEAHKQMLIEEIEEAARQKGAPKVPAPVPAQRPEPVTPEGKGEVPVGKAPEAAPPPTAKTLESGEKRSVSPSKDTPSKPQPHTRPQEIAASDRGPIPTGCHERLCGPLKPKR